jgi:hypothetical protein
MLGFVGLVLLVLSLTAVKFGWSIASRLLPGDADARFGSLVSHAQQRMQRSPVGDL